MDNAGINKSQFWAVVNNTSEIDNFNVTLQKYSGAKECERILQNQWAMTELTILKNMGFPVSCGVPPERENTCG